MSSFIGIIIAILISFLINSTLIEISICPFFSLVIKLFFFYYFKYYGIIFFGLGLFILHAASELQ